MIEVFPSELAADRGCDCRLGLNSDLGFWPFLFIL